MLTHPLVRPGLDVYCDQVPVREKVGVLTNVASLTSNGRTVVRALQQAGVEVTTLFSLEHGYFGVYAAGEHVDDGALRGIPVYSLYKHGRSASASDGLRGLNAMLIDLQDVGVRWYTYPATLHTMLRECAATGVPVYVLDRPNPLGGLRVEGNLADPALFSIVATAAIPVRYGLTLGELVTWLNRDLNAALHVVKMDGWRRGMTFVDTGLLWVAPSPGLPHPATVLPYTGSCLIEGLNVSEGRGTALPFEQIGAPFIQAEALADALNALNLPGAAFRPCWFRPQSSKHMGEACQGVRIHITDSAQFRGFAMGLHLVETLLQLYRDHLTWVTYEGRYFFDSLCATSTIREALVAGQPAAEIDASFEEAAQHFASQSRTGWLYS